MVFSTLCSKIDGGQIIDLLKVGLSQDALELVAITSALYNDTILAKCDVSDLLAFIKLFVKRIISEHEAKAHMAMSNVLIHVLENLKDIPLSRLLKVLEEIYDKEVFNDPFPGEFDTDIIMKIINTSKSRFFILAIELANKSFDDQGITKQLKHWLTSLFEEGETEWFYLACAYKIGLLHNIDSEWTDNYVVPKLMIEEIEPDVCVCMCAGTNVIYKSVVSYLMQFKDHDGLIAAIGNQHDSINISSRVALYLVGAKYYNHIDEKEYADFININYSNDFADGLVAASVSKIKNADFGIQKSLLKITYSCLLLNHNNDFIHRSVIKSLCRIENIDDECWEIILSALKQLNDKGNLWDDIAHGIYNTNTKNDEIGKVIEELKQHDTPEIYELERLFANLAKLNMMESIKQVAILAVNRGIGNINEIQSFIVHPELAVDKYIDDAY